jgi:hypothetical protein
MPIQSRRWDERRSRRTPARRAALIRVDVDGPTLPCVIWDISETGAKLAAGRPLLLPECFTLLFSATDHRRCQVRWRGEKFIGVEFVGG